MGNMHYATMLGYYAQLLGQTRMLQQTSKVHEVMTGFGTFGSEVGISSRFGLATGIKAGGIGLDIPVTKTVVADNNNKQNFLNYRLQAGMIASSLEHQTPEQMYNTDPANPVQGISTMKAFALANQQGQKIYTITETNINEVLPKIQASSLTKGDISSSVYAGKTVTVHEREVSVPGWTGIGYMVTDPVNGDGAYLISGGGNGGFAVASILSSMLLISVGIRNTLVKVLTGLKAIPAFSSIANVLILSSLIIKAVDIALNCKAASPMITGMMLMSAVIIGLSAIVAHAFNPVVAYIYSIGAITLLKESIDTTNCRKP